MKHIKKFLNFLNENINNTQELEISKDSNNIYLYEDNLYVHVYMNTYGKEGIRISVNLYDKKNHSRFDALSFSLNKINELNKIQQEYINLAIKTLDDLREYRSKQELFILNKYYFKLINIFDNKDNKKHYIIDIINNMLSMMNIPGHRFSEDNRYLNTIGKFIPFDEDQLIEMMNDMASEWEGRWNKTMLNEYLESAKIIEDITNIQIVDNDLKSSNIIFNQEKQYKVKDEDGESHFLSRDDADDFDRFHKKGKYRDDY